MFYLFSDFHILENIFSFRLSYEETEAYYRNLLDSESESDEEITSFEDDDRDEENLPDANVDSDAEEGQFEVEINEEMDSDEAEADEVDELTDDETPADNTFFSTKDGVKWFKKPPPLNRQGSRNIFREKPFIGPNPITKNLSRIDTFNCILSSAIRDLICRYSNKKAAAMYAEWNAKNLDKKSRTWKPITDDEFSAYLGILLVMGCQKSKNVLVTELWKKNTGPPWRATKIRRVTAQYCFFITSIHKIHCFSY